MSPDRRAPASREQVRSTASQMRGGSKAKYRDRPTDDGMKGDGADEPNAGVPRVNSRRRGRSAK
jgi:hypothetical protein